MANFQKSMLLHNIKIFCSGAIATFAIPPFSIFLFIFEHGTFKKCKLGQILKAKNEGEKILFKAIEAPFHTILDNAGLKQVGPRPSIGLGVNVVTGKDVDMISSGIIDPVLVTKSALKNAVSVVTTIISADCVISNQRADESS